MSELTFDVLTLLHSTNWAISDGYLTSLLVSVSNHIYITVSDIFLCHYSFHPLSFI